MNATFVPSASILCEKAPPSLRSPSLHKLNLFPLHLTQEKKHTGPGALIQAQ